MGRLDFGVKHLRLEVEADGNLAHRGDDRAAADRWRDARFRAEGWTIERCTWWEVRSRPAQLQARIAARVRELTAAA